MYVREAGTMTAAFLILAGILAGGAWCIITKAGEKENICQYGYITEEEPNHDHLR
jgi:hypothetical protein